MDTYPTQAPIQAVVNLAVGCNRQLQHRQPPILAVIADAACVRRQMIWDMWTFPYYQDSPGWFMKG
jgi:hypothetical protein